MPDNRPELPRLEDSYCGPLLEIESHIVEHQKEIETWFRQAWRKTPAPFYASVDLRNAGFKLAPVDTNLFPAGFNNLNHDFDPLVIQAIQAAVEHACPEAEAMLIVPERHTRNLYYLESLTSLVHLVELAGFEVRVGTLETIDAPATFELPSGRTLVQHPVRREGARLVAGDFSPCTVLLNNDLSGGRQEMLEGLEQAVIPPPALGWWNRSKHRHFSHYCALARDFCQVIDIDPWRITPMMADCGQIDFLKREGEDCLAEQVGKLLERISEKYREHGIDREPFVVIKADAGTYGMGVMVARSADEVVGLNRKQRTRMSASKEGLGIRRVLIQEGVHSFETVGAEAKVAEPVLYMVDHYVIGGFYRVHTEKGVNENLNAPGAQFVPLPFTESCITPNANISPDADPNRLYTYGVVARLALLAAAREQAEMQEMPT
ncbi:MAG: glutamate--cysteine ligase [Halothiobacillaceae bacterium]